MASSSPSAFYSVVASASTPLRRSFCTRLVLVYVCLLLDVMVVHWASPGGRARTAEALAFYLLGELYVARVHSEVFYLMHCSHS